MSRAPIPFNKKKNFFGLIDKFVLTHYRIKLFWNFIKLKKKVR